MLGFPGTPTTAVTRPPPTAGPRLRNFMFSSGSFDAVDLSAAPAAAADVFWASPGSAFAVLFLAAGLAAWAGVSLAGTNAGLGSSSAVTTMNAKRFFIREFLALIKHG